MSRFNSCVTAICLCLPAMVHADDADSLFETTMEKWSAASRDCRSFDTRLTLYEYDRMWGDKKPRLGRFVYQRGGASRYQVDDYGDMLWTPDATIDFNHKKKSYWQYSKDELVEGAKRRNEALDAERHWWTKLELAFTHAAMRSEEVVPYHLLLDPEELQSRYTLSVEERDDRVFLTAKAKRIRNDDLDELQFCFKRDSSLPFAVRQHWTSGRVVVHVLNETHLNDVAKDDAFLSPDLRSWQKLTNYKGGKIKANENE